MIIKACKDSRQHFVILDTRAPRDRRLSLRARGLHTYLMTMHETWEIRVGQLVGELSEGRAAIRAALNELEAAGYLKREKIPGPDGKLAGTTMKLFEIPWTPLDTERPFSGRSVPSDQEHDRPETRPTGNRPLSKDHPTKRAEAPAVGLDPHPINETKDQRVEPAKPPKESRATRRDRTADEIALANLVDLDLLASPAIKEAWGRFKAHRTERATRPLSGEKAAPWTERAALMQRSALERIVSKWGEAAAIEQITRSVDRRWIDIYEPKNAVDKRPAADTLTMEQLKKF